MNHPPQSVYQQVIEKTKGAFFRTQVLRFVFPLLYLISTMLTLCIVRLLPNRYDT